MKGQLTTSSNYSMYVKLTRISVYLVLFITSAYLPLLAQQIPSAGMDSLLSGKELKQRPSLLTLTLEEIQWLQAHPQLSVGIMSGWPPFNFVDSDGVPQGIGVDIIDEINLRLGYRLHIKAGEWHDIYHAVKEKKLDLLLDITADKSHEPFFNFTTPYLEVPYVFVAKRTSDFISFETDLINKRLALEKGFDNVNYFQQNYPGVKLKLYENTLSALEAVSRGGADAYAGNRVVALYLIEQQALSNLNVHGRLSTPASRLTIGTRKDYLLLRDILQKVLNDITEQGLREIRNRWIHAATPTTEVAKIGLTAKEKNWLSQHRRIQIGVDGNWPPIDFFDKKNQFQGITADYLALIGNKIGVDFIPQQSETFKTMLNKVMQGELKAGATISFKQERAKKLLFSEPFFHAQKVIMTRKEVRDIADITALYGKTVAIEDGFLTMRQLQEKHPQIRLLPVKSTLQALKAVSFAKADAYVGNQAVAAWLSQKNQLTNLKITGDPGLGSGPQNFAVAKSATDWAPLISIMDKALASISLVEKIRIENRWLGQISTTAKTIPALKLSNKEKAWLQQHNEITLGVDAGWQPLEFINEQGQYQGLSSEFMHYFSSQLDINFNHPEKLSWSNVLDGLKNKTIDLAPLLTKTEQRTEFLNFTKPYLHFPVVIFNRQGQTLLNGLTDLADSKVGVVQGYAISEFIARDYPSMQQLFFSSTQQGLEALSIGQIDAFVDLLAVGGYLMASSGLSNVQVAASTPYAHDFAIGVRKDWPELVALLNRAIEQLPVEKKNEFLKKWLVLRYQQKIDYTLLYWVLGVSLIIVIIFTLRAREMAKINDKLQQANEAVEKSSHFKSQFLANMSHEIRTPMNAIVGLGHLLSRTRLNEKQLGYINNLQISAQSLLSLIDDILDISKIEAGHIRIDPIQFNLEQLLQDLAQLTTFKLSDKDLEFIYQIGPDVPLIVTGDSFRINQILTNLVSNAIKFTESGDIILKVTMLDITGSMVWLQFEVSDTGIGIARNKLQHLFDPFEQEDSSTTRKYGGTGLGLSICRQLTELMGGEMNAESTQGEGSKFYFKLPFSVGDQKYKIIDSPDPDLRGLKVLLVDDNPNSLDILYQMMESMSFIVSKANSGKQALQQLNNTDTSFDLVLLDWRMPGMDGEQTAKKIRQQLPREKLPIIIMMTAYGRETIEQKIDRTSLDGFLIKPITPSQLFNVIIQTHKDTLSVVNVSNRQTHHPTWITETLEGQVLLAEDNKINQQVASEILQQMGLDVLICNTGIEVLDTLQKQQPDIILMDIQMPEMDGYEATRKIRGNPETQELPIIAMTANALTENIEKSMQTGMQEHISKPVDPEVLYQVLSRYLNKRSRQDNASTRSAELDVLNNWPDSIPGLNIKQGIKQIGGNEQLYQKLLKDFLNNHEHAGKTLARNIRNNELQKAAREAHILKGVAGNIGADRMQTAASQIDNKLNNKEAITDELLQSFTDSFNELCNNLHELIDGHR